MNTTPKPVALQCRRVRALGGWREIIQFDAGDAVAEHFMREAVEALASVDDQVEFRVVTCEVLAVELLTYTPSDGWKPA